MGTVVVESLAGLPVWLQIITILSFSIVAAKAIELLGRLWLHRSGRFVNNTYDLVIIEELYAPLYITVFLTGVYFSAQLVPVFGLDFYISAVAISIILVVWASAIIRLGNRIIETTNNSPSGRNITPLFKNLLTFFITVATFFLLLSVWAVDVTPLLASAGVIGIILGIAARDSLGNFFGGISLYLDKTYKIGDVVQLDSDERGTVLDMSIRSTTLLTRDNITVTIPNAEMNSAQIINESAPVRRRRIRLDVGVAYGSDLEAVSAALLAVADDEPLVLETPPPTIQYREFADSAIVVQLQVHIEHPAQRGRTRHQLIGRIDKRFREDDISIPFPQRTVSYAESGSKSKSKSKSKSDFDFDSDSDSDSDSESTPSDKRLR